MPQNPPPPPKIGSDSALHRMPSVACSLCLYPYSRMHTCAGNWKAKHISFQSISRALARFLRAMTVESRRRKIKEQTIASGNDADYQGNTKGPIKSGRMLTIQGRSSFGRSPLKPSTITDAGNRLSSSHCLEIFVVNRGYLAHRAGSSRQNAPMDSPIFFPSICAPLKITL